MGGRFHRGRQRKGEDSDGSLTSQFPPGIKNKKDMKLPYIKKKKNEKGKRITK